MANAPFLESTILGHPEDSVESILWVNQKLFSTGLNGMIREYDLSTLKAKYELAVTGGSAWCFDVNQQKDRLAVGTEDGYINTFTVTSDSLIYERIFDKQNGRILCIKWDNTGDMIFTGSTDTVRVWNAISGHAIHKMTTSRKYSKNETIVWCLAVTDDNIVVSGDSRGVLSFWDPQVGTLIESHESHTADILAICMTKDTKVVYCAGVDPVVRSFAKVTLKSCVRSQWVKGIERRLHAHDVRALVDADGKLYSAGVDGYLAQSSYPPKVLVKYPPLLQPPCVTVCQKSRCILLRYPNFLQLWKLGTSSKTKKAMHPGMLYTIEENPINLLQLRTKNDESIISYAISKDSRIIVYSTDTHIRLYNFDVIDGQPQLMRNYIDLGVNRVQKMLFSPNGKKFITINNNASENIVTLFDVEKLRLKLEGSFVTTKQGLGNIGLVCFSPDSTYLICADRAGLVVIYPLNEIFDPESSNVIPLPRYSCPPTAMAVQKDTSNLVVVYSDHKVR